MADANVVSIDPARKSRVSPELILLAQQLLAFQEGEANLVDIAGNLRELATSMRDLADLCEGVARMIVPAEAHADAAPPDLSA